MIVRIKKRDLGIVTLSLILIMSLILTVSMPLIYAATINTTTAGFGVWLVISNQNPVNITISNASGFMVDPIAGDNAVIRISFNASDPDGVEQINGTTGGRVIVNLTLGTPDVAQFRTQSSCVNTTYTGYVQFTCTINMRYYDNESNNWFINITVLDSGSGSARNDSHKFTYNSLSSFSIRTTQAGELANLNFTSLNIGQANIEAKAPLVLNNTGNDDFEQINITASALIGQSNGGTFGVDNFAVNVTNNTAGLGLVLSTAAQVIRAPGAGIPNATLPHGPGISGDVVPYSGTTDTKGNQTLIFWVDVPIDEGLTAQTYNATWNITVIDLPYN